MKNFLLAASIACVMLILPQDINAQDIPGQVINIQNEAKITNENNEFVIPKSTYVVGKVVELVDEGKEYLAGYNYTYQKVKIKIAQGEDKDKIVELKQLHFEGVAVNKLKKGDEVVITISEANGEKTYNIADKYRLNAVYILIAVFLVLIALFGRVKGIASIMGLVASTFVIIQYIVPQLAAGKNPFFVALTGVLIISFTSLYLAHGFTRRTTVALIATLITLAISIILAKIAVDFTQLTGIGSEEAFYLQIGTLGKISMAGLLLGGILIGTLGVLDDVTTSQVAAIDEISKANPKRTIHELYKSGISVGHEHIASLVNTLFLAYAGVSLPLFLLLTQNHEQPLWAIINGEQFIEEIVRTIVGSTALMLAVPISTILASYYFSKRNQTIISNQEKSSSHL